MRDFCQERISLYFKRNPLLDRIKKLYIKKIMSHTEKKIYDNLFSKFNLKYDGYIIRDEFIKVLNIFSIFLNNE